MNGFGKQHQLTAGCNKYDIKILAIQEHRQIFEDQEIKFEWNDEGTWLKVLVSANRDGTGGIGFFIERSVTKALKAVTKVCSRIIVAALDGNPQTTIIAVYAPTNAAPDEEKESFYKQLHDVLTTIPVHNILIVLGDLMLVLDTTYTNQIRACLARMLTIKRQMKMVNFCKTS